MNRNLLILGTNILAISALAFLYGLVTDKPPLVGVALSSILMGLVLLVSSFAATEIIANALIEYSRLLSKALTSIVEDVDLLESKLCVVRSDEGLRLIIAKAGELKDVDPGLGVRYGGPYLAIPVDDVLKDVSQIEEVGEGVIESGLNSVLVESLGLCSRVLVRQSGRFLKIELIEPNKTLDNFRGLPVNPFNMLVSVALSRIVGKDVMLVEAGSFAGGVYFTHEVMDSGGPH
ncbi:MAG: hypothetical protein QXK83_01070 [Zestosphaera sp.]